MNDKFRIEMNIASGLLILYTLGSSLDIPEQSSPLLKLLKSRKTAKIWRGLVNTEFHLKARPAREI